MLNGATCTARLLPDPFAVAILRGVYTNLRDYYKEGQLIDSILEASEYRADLTPAFIDRSFHWWGEIQNRLPRTKGYYLQTLSADDNPRSDLILAILESIRRLADWEIVKQTAGHLGRVRQALVANSSQIERLGTRLLALQAAIRTDLTL